MINKGTPKEKREGDNKGGETQQSPGSSNVAVFKCINNIHSIDGIRVCRIVKLPMTKESILREETLHMEIKS